jgi:hypothetical protein
VGNFCPPFPDPADKINADPEPDPELQDWNKIALLIAVSFSAMFEHDMEEKKNSRVEVKDVEADVMADMLRYPDMHRYGDMLIAHVCRHAQICRHAHCSGMQTCTDLQTCSLLRYADVHRYADMLIAQVGIQTCTDMQICPGLSTYSLLRYPDMHRYADMPRFVDMLIAQVSRHAQICRYAQVC